MHRRIWPIVLFISVVIHAAAFYVWQQRIGYAAIEPSLSQTHLQVGLKPISPPKEGVVDEPITPADTTKVMPNEMGAAVLNSAMDKPVNNIKPQEPKLTTRKEATSPVDPIISSTKEHVLTLPANNARQLTSQVAGNKQVNVQGRAVAKAAKAPLTPVQTAPPSAASVVQLLSKDVRYKKTPLAPKYPRSARRRGVEGVVMLRVSLSPLGEISLVQIEKSSGNIALDQAAIKAAKQWQFYPAEHDGVVVAADVLIPVNFTLEKGR
ncbi:energy transducer TonB [Neptunomonas phycophila]|uniref:energy transducer TonB n=1 Tax=Neptunomonas phycophila TaxID=1572645 RepID=UPI0026E317FC|nr:energy transducer TonB [Neptunomonas phycophila]MDO6784654.1 energy transducer TonB [Neptunomonas phycophila]